MKVILDTNVFISGIFFTGPSAQILIAWKNQYLRIVLSSQILDEYQRVTEILSSRFPLIDISPIIDLVIIHGQFIDTQGCDISICEDPDDNKFLECAVAGACNTIVSGDKHLLRLAGHEGIAILSPRDFVTRYL